MLSPNRFLICAVLLTGAPLLGQTKFAPPDPAADRLVAEAVKVTPDVQVAAANVEAAKARVVPARTLPDPMASLTFQNDGRGFSLGRAEGSFVGLMLTQPLPWPGKLDLAGRIAQSEARETEARLLPRAERTVEARVRNAWYDLLLANAIDRLIDERRATAEQVEASARERYAAGIGMQQDVLRAQTELARIEEMKLTQGASITARLAELNHLTGREHDATMQLPAALPVPPALPDEDVVITAVDAASPEIAATRQGVATGDLELSLARRNFLPDFSVTAGSMDRGNFAMGPMWQVGVGVTIPLWVDRRQQNRLTEAAARLTARTAEVEAIRQHLELHTHERIAEAMASDASAAIYRDKILPLDQLSLESAMASYTSGKVPFVTVLDAMTTLFTDRATYTTRLAESAKWRVAIDEASLDTTTMR